MSHPRDAALLDALEAVAQRPFTGTVWRSVGEGRDPLSCWRSGGRWDDGSFDVLYCSATREAAIEERRFHLFRGQPIPPSRVRYEFYEIELTVHHLMAFDSLAALAALGIDTNRYGRLTYPGHSSEYPSTQAVAEACHFLDADAIRVPSARAPDADNIILFCDADSGFAKRVVRNHGVMTW